MNEIGRDAGARDAASTFAVLRGKQSPDLLRDELLCEIFAATATTRPDALALETFEQRISYRELDARAKAVARGLLAHGAGPGDVIGLWAPRGPEALVSQLAIAMTGAAWLPFDADAPVERIATCLRDAKARLLLVGDAFAGKADPVAETKTLIASKIAVTGDDPLPTARELGATPDHPAYLIYTSGSTGEPKGTVVTGRNICHYLRAANEIYRVCASDVMFQGASLAFDLSMEEIWIAYLAGAALFVATPEIMSDTDALPKVLEDAGVPILDTVPTLLNALPRDVRTLKTIILGGEACPPTVAERWAREGRVIYNSYGPTEATVVATVAEVKPGRPVTIGRPIPNYSCYVVNEALELLAPGVEGELLIGGPGVARGYLKRETLTAEKFIDNPFPSNGGDPILYRSGDAVSVDEKGDLVFRGRVDDQIKIRGFRVELGEIETVLCRQDNVRQAAVALRRENGLDELVAFLVADGEAPEAPELRGALRKVLPLYMVPSRFQPIDALPTLTSGKVDRKALAHLIHRGGNFGLASVA
jgi:amino acid adenylation domain-containing protein